MSAMRDILLLDGTPVPEELLGGKGSALNRLIGAGFVVPRTTVVTSTAYRRFIGHSDLSAWLRHLGDAGHQVSAEDIDHRFATAPMPADMSVALTNALREVRGQGRLAVRSSATAEDMAAASFAGQYRSILEITDEDEALAAVRLVWASLWHPAPRAYRQHLGISDPDLAMAVVIMPLVEAEHAGVAFTVDPTGDGSTARVEHVEGLAEQLVSGAVTPVARSIPRVRERRGPLPPFVAEALDTALTIEASFGAPQDVEWAHDGRQLWIVQSRAITTLTALAEPRVDGFDTVIGAGDTYTTAGVAEMLPGVLPPLQWSTAAPLLEDGFRRLYAAKRALPGAAEDAPFIARVRGRAVLNLGLIRAAAELIPGGSAAEVDRQYFGRVLPRDDSDGDGDASELGTTPSPAPRRFRAIRGLTSGYGEISARRAMRREARIVMATIHELVTPDHDLALLTDAELSGYRARVLDLAARAVAAEVEVASAASAAYQSVEAMLRQHFPDEAGALTQYLTAGGLDASGEELGAAWGYEDPRTEARAIALDPEIEALLATEPDPSHLPEVLAGSTAGRMLLTMVERGVGHAPSTAVFGGPTWAEAPDQLWSLIAADVRAGLAGRSERVTARDRMGRLAEVEHRITAGWKWRMTRILTGQFVDVRVRMMRRQVFDAVEFLMMREQTKSSVLELGGEVRRIHLEFGTRLVARGLLDQPGDVDLLSSRELEQAFDGAVPSAVERRRRLAALHVMTEDALPQVFTGDASRSIDLTAGDGTSYSGWAASAGVYEGPARVVTSAAGPLYPGDVLVARVTDPAWTPLFLTAGAIVVEEGGPLSHAAIIARELGVPAVLNVPGIVRRLSEAGEVRILVDGSAGTVELLPEPGSIPTDLPPTQENRAELVS